MAGGVCPAVSQFANLDAKYTELVSLQEFVAVKNFGLVRIAPLPFVLPPTTAWDMVFVLVQIVVVVKQDGLEKCVRHHCARIIATAEVLALLQILVLVALGSQDPIVVRDCVQKIAPVTGSVITILENAPVKVAGKAKIVSNHSAKVDVEPMVSVSVHTTAVATAPLDLPILLRLELWFIVATMAIIVKSNPSAQISAVDMVLAKLEFALVILAGPPTIALALGAHQDVFMDLACVTIQIVLATVTLDGLEVLAAHSRAPKIVPIMGIV